MAYIFGDGFDCYATPADALAGYWDSGINDPSMVAGRFAGSQALAFANAGRNLVKSSGVNDALHHVVMAVRDPNVLTGTSAMLYCQLSDGVTAQCSVVFRQDGVILLTSGGPTGTTLATTPVLVTAQSTWFAFEIEVFISNTAGYMNIRKNGNTVNDFTSATNLNTRVSANNYANKLTIGMQNAPATNWAFDDLLWRSDATSLPWLGDIRCFTRMPGSDASAQFAKSPTTSSFFFSTNATNGAGPAASTIWFYSLQVTYTGNITALLANFVTSVTAHVNMAVYDATGANMTSGNSGAAPINSPGPGSLLGTATPLTNPVTGMQTFTLVTPAPVTKNQIIWVAMIADAGITTAISGSAALIGPALSFTYSGGAFPATATGFTMTGSRNGFAYLGAVVAPANAALVNETLQDGTTTYVYDATAGHADLYNIAGLSPAPVTVHAVTTRGFVAKSDAGTRTGAMQIKSGTTVVPTTWNPADLINITLSGGNLIATPTGGGGVRSLGSATGGSKYYWEGTWGVGTASGFGVANSSATLSTVINTGTGAAFVSNSGASTVNGVSQTNIGAFGAGGVCCIALDVGAQFIWFRNGSAGNWNGSGTANPATGVGGWSINSIEGTSNPIFALCGAVTAASSITVNFGAAAFAGVVPSGFTSGFGPTGTTVASPTLALSSSFLWAWRTDTLNPNGNVAWTPAAVDAIQTGPLVVS